MLVIYAEIIAVVSPVSLTDPTTLGNKSVPLIYEKITGGSYVIVYGNPEFYLKSVVNVSELVATAVLISVYVVSDAAKGLGYVI